MRDGVFANHVGADGTSIWSAATSGPSAIAMHLLACMLARFLSHSEATSLLVELVAERKKEIHASDNDGQVPAFASRMAAHQSITRSDLASWDASAHAWLFSADEAMRFEQTQLRLILRNTGLKIDSGAGTY